MDPMTADNQPPPTAPTGIEVEAIREALANATPGPWVWMFTGEKSNGWAMGTWQLEDGTWVPAGVELQDWEMERYVAAGEPDEPEDAIIIDEICESFDGNNYADAHLIANAPTWLASLLSALEEAQREQQLWRAEWEQISETARVLQTDLAAEQQAHERTRAERDQLATVMDAEVSFRDLEVKIRDGEVSLRAIGSEEGGNPVQRLVCAMLLNLLLGEENEMPPNYRVVEWKLKPGGEVEAMRIIGEIVRDGHPSSHELRLSAEATLEARNREVGELREALKDARTRVLNASKHECTPAFFRELLDLLPAATTPPSTTGAPE